MAYKLNTVLDKLIQTNLKTNRVPMLVGEPAIGKSSWVEALAEKLGTKCFTLQCNELSEKADLTGVRTIPLDDTKTKYKQVFFPHADIMDAIEYAKSNPDETPLLFLDEINRTSSDLTSALLSIPTRRKIGSEELPSNLRIIIAGNDKGNVTTLDTASVSRFIIYNVIPDAETFLAVNENINPLVQDILMHNPDLIFCKGLNPISDDDTDPDDIDNVMDMFDDDTMEQFTAPRTLTALSDFLNDISEETLKDLQHQDTQIVHRGQKMTVSALLETLVSHIGYTEFSLKLLDGITKELNQINPSQVQRPVKYDDLIQNHSSTITSIQDFVKQLDDAEKSATLLYALTDDKSSIKILRTIISELAKITPTFTPNDLKAYIDKHKDGTFVPALNHFLRTNSELTSTSIVATIKAITAD